METPGRIHGTSFGKTLGRMAAKKSDGNLPRIAEGYKKLLIKPQEEFMVQFLIKKNR